MARFVKATASFKLVNAQRRMLLCRSANGAVNASPGQRPGKKRFQRPALKARSSRHRAYRFFPTQSPIRSNAFSMFSIELATLKRK